MSTYAVMECHECESSWPAELPPLDDYTTPWPRCECGKKGIVQYILKRVDCFNCKLMVGAGAGTVLFSLAVLTDALADLLLL